MKTPLHVLYIGRDASDNALICKTLERENNALQVTTVTSRQDFDIRLRQQVYELIISDCHVSDLEPTTILQAVHAHDPVLPVVFMIDYDEEEKAVEVMNHGAFDYVLKTPQYLQRLPCMVRSALEKRQLRAAHDRATRELSEYAERLEVVNELDQAVDEELQRRARRLEVLREIDQAILEVRNPGEIATAALQALQKLIPFQCASLVVFHLKEGEATILATHTQDSANLIKGQRLSLDALHLPPAFHQGEIRIIDDVTNVEEPMLPDGVLFQEHIHSYIMVPLITRNVLVGSLNLGMDASKAFLQEYIDVAEEVAGPIAIAVQQSRLYTRIQEHASKLEQRVMERTADLEAAVEHVAHELRRFIDSANAPIFGIDAQGRITEWNLAATKITGFSKNEVLGKHLVENFIAKEHQEAVQHIFDLALDEIETANFELPLHTKSGEQLLILLNASTRRNDEGDITGVVGVGQDITQRKIAEDALKKAKEEAEAASRLKSEFLANISHEIRTPMNAILGFTDLLGEHEAEPEKRKQLDIIKKAGQQLLHIISALLDFAKLEAGKVELQYSLFVFKEMLQHLYQQFLPQAQQQQLNLIVEADDDVPALVRGDETRIMQLLGNVLHNAIKFTRKGHVTLRVKTLETQNLSCESQDSVSTSKVSQLPVSGFQFHIEDTGIGIPKDKLGRIFAPFEQVDASATRHHGGVGLGLAITQKLVRLMGGTVSAESQFGHGTTVIIELPLSEEAEEKNATRKKNMR